MKSTLCLFPVRVPFSRAQSLLKIVEGLRCDRFEESDSNDIKNICLIFVQLFRLDCTLQSFKTKPGPITQSMWLKTASRILHFYFSTSKPSDALQVSHRVAQRVYAPVCFAVKEQLVGTDGPTHLWKVVQLLTFFPNVLKKTVHSVIRANAYCSHPENLLLEMLTHKNPDIRTMALNRKNAAIQRRKRSAELANLKVLKSNFRESENYDCIESFSTDITKPPITTFFSLEEIERNQYQDRSKRSFCLLFKSHARCDKNVQRTRKKIVTETTTKISRHEGRNAFMREKLQPSEKMLKFTQDFVV